jgi:hypothetical protein
METAMLALPEPVKKASLHGRNRWWLVHLENKQSQVARNLSHRPPTSQYPLLGKFGLPTLLSRRSQAKLPLACFWKAHGRLGETTLPTREGDTLAADQAVWRQSLLSVVQKEIDQAFYEINLLRNEVDEARKEIDGVIFSVDEAFLEIDLVRKEIDEAFCSVDLLRKDVFACGRAWPARFVTQSQPTAKRRGTRP